VRTVRISTLRFPLRPQFAPHSSVATALMGQIAHNGESLISATTHCSILRHVMACPEFDRTGLCKAVGRCPFPHVDRSSSSGAGEGKKKVAPVKPKRKSLGKTPDCSKKSKVAAGMGVRYYTEQDKEEKLEEGEEDLSGGDEISEAKRKRLLRKIELAKQGWTGVTVTPAPGPDPGHDPGLDESGPYEQMPEEEEEVMARPPVGSLGDFISLAGYSSEEEEVATANGNHRLI